jgi:hypothetical protein
MLVLIVLLNLDAFGAFEYFGRLAAMQCTQYFNPFSRDAIDD